MTWLHVPQFIFLLHRSQIIYVKKVTDMICLQTPMKCVNRQIHYIFVIPLLMAAFFEV